MTDPDAARAQAILNTWHLTHYQRYHAHIEAELQRAVAARAAQLVGGAAASAPADGAAPVVQPPRPRILLAAPSNAAVDEALRRLMARRFIDANGAPYAPVVARAGVAWPGMSPEVRQVRIDTCVGPVNVKSVCSRQDCVSISHRSFFGRTMAGSSSCGVHTLFHLTKIGDQNRVFRRKPGRLRC